MEIIVVEERALALQPQLSMDQAEGRAWSRKVDAFGSTEKIASFLRRPSDDDFVLTYKEHRYEPVWHIECQALYVYDRKKDYPIELNGSAVTAVTIGDIDYQVHGKQIVLQVTEHCREEPHEEVFINGYTGERLDSFAPYLAFPANEIPRDSIDALADDGAIIVPPQSRATAIVRDVLLGVMKSLNADRIVEDKIEVNRIDLYYRPVYAFQYRWLSKDKEAVLEYDALTGELHSNGKTFQQYVGQIVDADFLFDVGVDSIDLLVPGDGIAIKLARKGYSVAKSRSD